MRSGLIDRSDLALRDDNVTPIADHLADWHRYMIDQAKTPRHADQYRERAGKLVALVRGVRLAEIERGRKPDALARAAATLANVLKTTRFSDLTSEGIQSALALLRTAGKANQTTNHYRAALRAFVRWAIDKSRLRDNPMQGRHRVQRRGGHPSFPTQSDRRRAGAV